MLYVKITTPMQQLAAALGVHLLPLVGGEGVRHGTVIDMSKASGLVKAALS